ncbi:hypothetical protein [Magnetococcus sp. PR-3]|uniref:hypothetical protein n=1 Tax=Magnetococcus sp. PR-3 TaxID=3120355 RepID=UPI002FCE5318
MVKALVRAHRWLNMLENGEVNAIKALAAQEELDDSYVNRLLRLTLLNPKLVEKILHGQQPEEMTLGALTKAFPVSWQEQR